MEHIQITLTAFAASALASPTPVINSQSLFLTRVTKPETCHSESLVILCAVKTEDLLRLIGLVRVIYLLV
jgi:hypothetical protein